VERGAGRRIPLTVDASAEGELCFAAQPVVTGSFGDADPQRIVTFEVRNGTGAGPLVIQGYDLGARGMRVVGLTRPEG
ncbi:MAG TPA: hypothetical protein VLM79_04675, partial [Kofleriaceae bacterium]|nr:hypothetical protein [Kofleriaceae bacterium]